MSDFFAEATVRLTPDMTGFVTELKKDVKAAVERVEGTPAAKVKVSPALTRDFVGNLRKQVNLAVAQAQKGVKPILIRAVLSEVSRAAISREVRAGAQTVRATTPAGALSGATRTAATSNDAFATSQERVNGLVGRGAILLDEHMAAVKADAAATEVANQARVKSLRAGIQSTNEMQQEGAAAAQLSAAKRELATANLAEAGSAARAAGIRAADLAARRAITLAIEEQDLATRHAAESFRTSLRATAGANAALNETSRAARQAASNMSQLRRGVLSTSLSFLGIRGATLAASARFLAGAAAIVVFAKALQSATEFAVQLNVFRATTQATADEMERVREAARALGADLSLPGVTAQDAAESMTELAKAGLGVQDSIAGARGVLQLATAAAIDNAQAVELAANAINAFGLAGRDATHVADVFANAANAAQGSIVDIGIAFQQASAAGRQVGLSFEDTSEFLTVLARNGLKGSDAGTSLRTALIRLIKPTDEARDALKELGVQVRDQAGNLRPDVFIQLAQATKDLSPAARDAKIALIGGQDAFRAITILGRQTIDDFIELRQELRRQGTAAELAASRMTGLRGSLEGLSNTLTSIGLRAGRSLTPALQSVTDGLSASAVSFADSTLVAQTFSSQVDALNISLDILGGTLSAVGTVLGPIIKLQATLVNTIGVPQILAAVVAYKSYGLALKGVDAILKSTAIANLAVAAAIRPTTFATAALRASFASLASALPLVQIGIAAVAVGLFFLLTRETAAERATRKLKEATEGLISANERLKSSTQERRDTGLGISSAQLGVLEAQQRAAQARAALNSSTAGEGTFARIKLYTELRVAVDNVAIAQNALADAIERSNAARDVEANSIQLAAEAHQKDVEALKAVVEQETLHAKQHLGRSPAALAGLESLALEKVSRQLEKRAQEARETNSAESIAVARRLELLKAVSNAVDQVPTDRSIDITINTPNLKGVQEKLLSEFGTTSEKLREELLSGLLDIDSSPQAVAAIIDLANKLGIKLVTEGRESGHEGGVAVSEGVATGIDQGAPKALAAVDRLLAQIKASLGRSAGLDVQENLAVIASGATGATLPVLQQKLAEARSREAAARAAIAASPVGETPTLRKRLREAIADQRALIEQIRGINESLASDAESAANEAETKQNEIFDNILKAMGIRRDARQQAIDDAALTEGVKDDLTATRKLRRLVNLQIERIQDRIRAARKEGLNVANLIAGLRVLEGIYRDLGRTVISLQKTRQQEIMDRAAESNQLDIEFAQLTDNRQLEVRARLREIARLKKLQALAKNDIIERKRLRNLIQQQIKAINEITTATKNMGAALTFQFLTTQQGFAANLLGNLLPIGAIGNTVGGNLARGGGPRGDGVRTSIIGGPGTPGAVGGRVVGGGVNNAAAAAAAAGGGIAAPTRGQQSVELELLRQILAVLRHMASNAKHPENKRQQQQAKAAMDGQGN